ncbi:MAG: HNH endonuclease [Culicoidibacterales bacterium]
MKSQYTQLLHQLLNQLPKASLPLAVETLPQAGLIIVLDPTEGYFTAARIVYVGYSGNCAKRWRQIFYGHAQNTLRAYLRQQLADEAAIDDYLQTHCQIVCLPCAHEQLAKTYAQQLVYLLQSDEQFQPSPKWLGRNVVVPPLLETKLWQSFAPQSLEFEASHIESLLELVANQEPEQGTSGSDYDHLALKAEQFISRPKLRMRQEWTRNPYVKAAILARAKGRCELCEQPAPFRLPDGTPYLEVHHVIPLEAQGPDTIANCVALCPNCHREVHYAPNDWHKLCLRNQ